jgi:hypothetical protein
MPDLDKELTEAYIDGLRDRLNKKEVKLGRLQHDFRNLIKDQHILEDEIATIKHTIKKWKQQQ